MKKLALLTLATFIWTMLFTFITPVKPALAAAITVSNLSYYNDTSPTLSSSLGKFTTPPASPDNRKTVAVNFNVYGYISTASGGNKIYVLWDGNYAPSTVKGTGNVDGLKQLMEKINTNKSISTGLSETQYNNLKTYYGSAFGSKPIYYDRDVALTALGWIKTAIDNYYTANKLALQPLDSADKYTGQKSNWGLIPSADVLESANLGQLTTNVKIATRYYNSGGHQVVVIYVGKPLVSTSTGQTYLSAKFSTPTVADYKANNWVLLNLTLTFTFSFSAWVQPAYYENTYKYSDTYCEFANYLGTDTG